MADTQTTTETIAAQPQQQELSALERARAADTRIAVTLGTVQAYDELELFGSEASEFGADSSVQGEYWRFKFRGAIVTVSPEFKKAYDDGTMLSITATPTVFEQTRPDPLNAGMKKAVVGYGWSLSFSDVAKKQKAAAAIKKSAEIEFSIKKNEAMAAKKLEAFQAMDLSKLITEDDMKAMLADV